MYQENQKKLLLANKEVRLQKEKDMLENQKYIESEALKQQLREEEFAQRLKKIQSKMDRMADTVVKNENEKRVKEERRLLQIQTANDKKNIEVEQEKKRQSLMKNIEINQ